MADTDAAQVVDWSGRLFLGPGLVLYLGPGGAATAHSHHAVQIVQSFDSSMALELDATTLRVRAAIVPSGVRHAFGTDAERMILALVEPHGARGSGLDRRARELSGQDIQPLLAGAGLECPPAGSVEDLVRLLLGALHPAPPAAPILSDPVRAALDHLEHAIERTPRLDDAARAACISPSRLTHRFSTEVGMPFRRYVLWLRLRRAVREVAAGANLTEAAVSAGFSDSAHLSRVFRATFGLPPSALLRMREVSAAWPAQPAQPQRSSQPG